MRILVAEGDIFERKRICDLLVEQGHSVRAPLTPAAVLSEACAEPPEIAILDPKFSAAPWGLVGAFRTLVASGRVYVIVNLREGNASDYADAWAAGADDVVRRPAPPEELQGRCDALPRVLSWANRAAPGGTFNLDRLRVWREVEEISAAELGEMLGLPLQVGAPAPVDYAAEILLTLLSARTEVRLTIGIDRASAAVLSKQLLGGPCTVDVLADMLREFVNVLAGACKRGALPDGYIVSIGLPVSRSPFDPAAEGRSWGLVADGLRFTLQAPVSPVCPRFLPARDLLEGMVLAQDIRGSQGLLMLSAGAALTARTTVRIAELVGELAMVQVTGGPEVREPILVE